MSCDNFLQQSFTQGLKFEVIPSTCEDSVDKSQYKHPPQFVEQVAIEKGLDVARTLYSETV